jgi:hypothetical protein
MISFDLCCSKGHGFEGWFASSGDYDSQKSAGLLTCPLCEDPSVQKMLSVPNIGRKGNQAASIKQPPATETPPAETSPAGRQLVNTPVLPQAMVEIVQKIAAAQTEMLENSQWVGRQFAETARAIHYGESDNRLIHGEASRAEAEALAEEGVAVAPLLVPFIPPEAKN